MVLAYQNLARARFELGDLWASLALFKQSLLLDPEDKNTRLDYEIVYTILYGSENQLSESQTQDNEDGIDGGKAKQPRDQKTNKERTDKRKSIGMFEASDLSRGDIQQILEDMDVQIEKLQATFGEELTAEEAYALLKLIEERAQLAGLRTSVSLETNSEAR
jgi:tetratricopeptide (TPR) repeat protein